ncbi:chemokine like factor [Rhinolophus ferrumequinum]|uniref:Chemokine like factor n=1 Tax=Rhinolophus ferrumequinum TaxID=59479 RepID=A0A7J7SHP1_RHIFE|nr:chemokine like factor [Rhinolophus ferrumequinum]
MSALRLTQEQRPFYCSVKAFVKMLRLGLTVTSMTFFIISQAPEPYIVITGFEVTVVFFFIMLYMFRLDRIINFIFWPLLLSANIHKSFQNKDDLPSAHCTSIQNDIINSLVTATFMITISVLALTTDNTFTVLGGVLGLLAAVCCLADAALIYRKLLFNPSGPFQKSPDKI